MDDITAGKPNAWSDPAVTEANKKIQELVKAGGFVKGFSSISTDSGADVALLYTGKAAMTLGLPATYQTIKTANPQFVKDGKLGYVPFPVVEGGKGDPANVVGNPTNFWSISAAATPEQKQAAREYVKSDLLNEKYAADLLAVGNVPPVEGAEDAIAASDDPAYYSMIYETAKKAPNFQLSLDQALAPRGGRQAADHAAAGLPRRDHPRAVRHHHERHDHRLRRCTCPQPEPAPAAGCSPCRRW
ncbi:extracellular solute-binding protein [Nonomuraea salmonea]|uniref:extracellular solute-binding protein n=1 Tax=Nonomuraea salmonea TaxID=46181 RepID=UPI002FE9111B